MAVDSKTLSDDVLNRVIYMRKGTAAPAEEPKSTEPEFTLPEFELPDGHKEFKDVFGFNAPSGRKHAVRQFDDAMWHEDVRCFIPNLDKHYVWPKEATERAVVGLMQGDKILIVGPTGSGKSSLIKNICAKLRIPFVRVNLFNQVEYSAIFGMPKVSGGEMGYAHGPIGVLGMHGGVLCLDEFSSATADITMSMQYPLEDDGKIYLPDYPGEPNERLITPNELFRIVCTDNTELQGDTTGRHAGTNVQNTATLDRFQTMIRHGYLERAHEKRVLKSAVDTLPDKWADDMLKLAALVRDSADKGNINLTMSPRTLINWARKATYWGDLIKGLQMSFFDKLTDDDRKVVNEFIIKVFGKEIR